MYFVLDTSSQLPSLLLNFIRQLASEVGQTFTKSFSFSSTFCNISDNAQKTFSPNVISD